jgi:alpha-glucosidase
VAMMLLLTLRGTPTLYYGDEIGMHQVTIAPHQVRDPFEKNVPGIGVGRDGCRTPMQWDATAGAGFSSGTPWLPLADDHVRENVAMLEADRGSILNLYRALIALRKRTPQLVKGAYWPIAADGDILIYRRECDEGALTVALNLGNTPVAIAASSIGTGLAILLSTFLDRRGEDVRGALELRANEGVILGAADHAG